MKIFTGLFLLLIIAGGALAQQRLDIVFIGNSITQGVGLSDPAVNAPPARAAAWLKQQPGIAGVAFSNQGRSGFTTVDFLPSTGKAFNDVEAAANAFKNDTGALLIFSIKLGTNDSAIEGPNGSPVSAAGYRANLQAIADRLLADYPGCRIIFHFPLWYSPNTYNRSRYLQEGLDRLQSYFPEIEALVKAYGVTHPGQVYTGDKQAFAYFRKHYETDLQHENGREGVFYLHPNEHGAEVLGKFWGEVIWRVVRKDKHK